ncbi:uncharacterized protein [Parasteatoda tepidariorum]|uniref:uncharacterized protein isoform X2 n=2 Tax=Parasteatoda tepidariorum TaxID=114398 RepID=UPI000A2BFC85|nr:autophagy-related protein 8f isoform X1 [Parasteatoda tepidariorum]
MLSSHRHAVTNTKKRFNYEAADNDTHNLAKRKEEADRVLQKFPNSIPVIFEKSGTAWNLPVLDRPKWIVSEVTTISQLQSLVRCRIKLPHYEGLYFIIDNELVALGLTLAEVYERYKSEDNFLHITYASCEAFG